MRANHEWAVREHWIDLLEVDGNLAALMEMILEPDWVLIESIAVAPSFQGSGYARILLDRAQNMALGLGLKGVRLFTNKLFESNVDLYLRHGFVVDREEPFMGGITVYMSKPSSA